ncbi:VP5 [Wallal virus]|uniref:Outer capsid protein VP5 n=1 Tax=Wallal virus TaxID=40061 RepID=U3RHY0_9REOV|nr:VP5 [Wallal virus]AGX00992.1 VP5 [Wallal virus]
MGKFINTLNRVGKKTWAALNSSTAKKTYQAIGRVVEKVAQSEIGSAAIDGLIQGTVQSMITGESYGDSIKQAMILNILNTTESLPDPLSPGERSMVKRIKELEADNVNEKVYQKYNDQVIKLMGKEIKEVRDFALGQAKELESEEDQIKILTYAVDKYQEILGHEINGLEKLAKALAKESELRSNDEYKMVKEYRHKIDALMEAIKIEKESLQEEAVQQMVSMATDVLEATAEEVPIFGAATAAAIASGRAIEGAYKLKHVIENLTGINLNHVNTPKIQPETLKVLALKDTAEEVHDKELIRGIRQKIGNVRENMDEIVHIKEQIMPKFRKAVEDDAKILGLTNKKVIHPVTKMKFKISKSDQPSIHTYAAPWESDYVFMFHCVPPHHQPYSFFLGFDLELDYVFFEDLNAKLHMLNTNAQEVVGRSFKDAYNEFLTLASKTEGSTAIHTRRLARSKTSYPLYLSSDQYEIDFQTLRANAMEIVQNEEFHKHLLRGPLHFQRRAILGALEYGLAIMDRPFNRNLFLKYAL